ncbi:CD82 antigen-like [Trichogramma pretiosum]|uniref:CD82 antigen-like n=1 Tax=Trichogramma pretiosum TaxID=7493 RepID=UPI0006C9D97F|nr:CD82 antigen-like [Trichogramma pretiosum]
MSTALINNWIVPYIRMQEKQKLGFSRAFMCCTNIIFLISGFVLMSLGALLLADSERVLMSRLLGGSDTWPEQPLFYYVALGVVGLGFFIACCGLLGCWVSCLRNCCITVSYAAVIVVLLVSKCALCLVVVFWPHLVWVDVRAARLLRALQRSYALPGREQLTAALDLAQTSFSCCGINGSNNYGTSWWRLQELGRRELVVPLSCCKLNNTLEPEAFLNPQPQNLSLCQSLNPAEHQLARHTFGCLESIENWVQDQTLVVLGIGLLVVLVELFALMSTLLACSRLKSVMNQRARNSHSGSGSNNNKAAAANTCVQTASTFTSTQTLGPDTFGNEDAHDYGMSGYCTNLESRLMMAGTNNTFNAGLINNNHKS